MPATTARIGFITEEFRNVIAGPDADVIAAYGDLARDNSEAVETFFDNVADANIIAEERLALLSANRRRMKMEISGCETGTALTFDQRTPTAQMIDDERLLNRTGAIVEIGVDFDKNSTTVSIWG